MTQTQVDIVVDALWLVCVIVCFLKWKTWSAIFGIIGLILGNIPTTGRHLHYLVMGPATSLGLLVVAIRLAKAVSWWAKWFYWGPMDSDSEASASQPEIGEGVRSIPGAKDGF